MKIQPTQGDSPPTLLVQSKLIPKVVEVETNIMDEKSPLFPESNKLAEGTGKNLKVYVEGLGYVENFLASDDLNECVEALLKKRPKNNAAVLNSK